MESVISLPMVVPKQQNYIYYQNGDWKKDIKIRNYLTAETVDVVYGPLNLKPRSEHGHGTLVFN